jgi:hypothetical protein
MLKRNGLERSVKRHDGARIEMGRRLRIGAALHGMAGAAAHASVALLMEEPFGEFGDFNPTGLQRGTK